MVADGLANWERARLVLRVFVWCSVFMSVIGLMQATLPVQSRRVHGDSGVAVTGTDSVRGAGRRPAGAQASTTTHYLELARTLALAAAVRHPFCDLRHRDQGAASLDHRRPVDSRRYLRDYLADRNGVHPDLPALPSAGLAVAAAIQRARTGRLVAGRVVRVQLSAARTFYDMFAGANNDLSITSRTDRYELVGYYFAQRSWFGRGSGTWVPPMYQYLDNQWLGPALTNGLVGCAVLAALHPHRHRAGRHRDETGLQQGRSAFMSRCSSRFRSCPSSWR